MGSPTSGGAQTRLDNHLKDQKLVGVGGVEGGAWRDGSRLALDGSITSKLERHDRKNHVFTRTSLQMSLFLLPTQAREFDETFKANC